MPLPASLFLQRGRSDSMMNVVDGHTQQHATLSSQNTLSSSSSTSTSMLQASIDLDGGEAPMYTPPITMTAFDNQYGPHGLLASAMSSSYGSSPFTGNEYSHHHASSASSYPFNPRANLLRRTSSSSTLDSSEDEDEVAWSAFDVERLTAVYEACVEEASFETPFSGPPPSQLLHAIAKACRRAYGTEWPHSITQTRAKALQIAKEKERLENGDWAAFVRRPSVEATPKPPGATGKSGDTEATPRRKLRRNDSMDFLPENWDLDAVARLSDKLNKSGEDDHSLYQYPYRVRTDTCSSGSDGQNPPPRSAPLHGRLIRSLTYTSLHDLDDDAHFATSSMAQMHGQSNQMPAASQEYGEDYSQHPLAQSDPSLQMSSPLTMGTRRPSLRPSFDFFGSGASSAAATSSSQQSRQGNTLHHTASTSSFYSDDQSSSLYSAPSLNSSMDTMNLSAFSANGEDNHSIYGSSFASSIASSMNPITFSAASNRKRAFTGSMHKVDAMENEHDAQHEWKMNDSFGLVDAATNSYDGLDNGMMQTPSAVDEASVASDYFAAFETRRPSVVQLNPHSKRPANLSNITTSSSNPNDNSTQNKPPLMKSYTFDAISSKSPTKKYMRMSETGYNALDAVIPSPRSSMYPNGIGYSGGNGGAMMLESPFEMDFSGGGNQNGQNQKIR